MEDKIIEKVIEFVENLRKSGTMLKLKMSYSNRWVWNCHQKNEAFCLGL